MPLRHRLCGLRSSRPVRKTAPATLATIKHGRGQHGVSSASRAQAAPYDRTVTPSSLALAAVDHQWHHASTAISQPTHRRRG